ncbi:hypothetical protein AX15_000235 [Amanita polypyramis BW_CC]|nr:hypothetical protein AX15_000235 [Amanita polypyramis BW_CC]
MQVRELRPVRYESLEDHNFDTLASNIPLAVPFSLTSMSSPTIPLAKLSVRQDKTYPIKLINSTVPLQAIKLSTPNDIRSRSRRVLRISSRLRAYHDHRQASTSPGSSILSPSLKNVTLPPFPPPISASPSELKLRSRGRSPWRPFLFGLNESPTFWLSLYFLLNLSLTLYNKSVLVKFPFPYTLTAMHALCSAVGSSVLLRSNVASLQDMRQSLPLSWKEVTTLILFSTLFTVNIATSNASLGLVTIPFHQAVRATAPLFTMLVSQILLGTRSSRDKLTSLLPVVAGVAFATYGDYYFSYWGLILTFTGTILAALKTVATNMLQSSGSSDSSTYAHVPFTFFFRCLQPRPTLPKLSPLEHLHFLSPLAFVQSLLLAHLTGELKAVYHYTRNHLSYIQQIFLMMNGILAFGLNIASFGANRRVGAVSMSVAANVKQVLTILCAVIMFDLKISPANAIGIILTLVGGGWYTTIELREKKLMDQPFPSSITPISVEMGRELGFRSS